MKRYVGCSGLWPCFGWSYSSQVALGSGRDVSGGFIQGSVQGGEDEKKTMARTLANLYCSLRLCDRP